MTPFHPLNSCFNFPAACLPLNLFLFSSQVQTTSRKDFLIWHVLSWPQTVCISTWAEDERGSLCDCAFVFWLHILCNQRRKVLYRSNCEINIKGCLKKISDSEGKIDMSYLRTSLQRLSVSEIHSNLYYCGMHTTLPRHNKIMPTENLHFQIILQQVYKGLYINLGLFW